MTKKILVALLVPLTVGAQASEDTTRSPTAAFAVPVAAHPLRDAVAVRHREPVIAGVLGLFPGVGHVYAGEPKRGLAVFGIWFVSGFAGFNSPNRFVSNTGGFLLLATSAYSVVDAARAARRFNKRHAR